MTPSDTPREPTQGADERRRRRRAERLLGDLLPDQTSDETGDGWGAADSPSRDDELQRDVPPHHGS